MCSLAYSRTTWCVDVNLVSDQRQFHCCLALLYTRMAIVEHLLGNGALFHKTSYRTEKAGLIFAKHNLKEAASCILRKVL